MWFVYIDWTLEEVSRPFYVGKGDKSRVCRLKRNKHHEHIAEKYGMRREIIFETKDEPEAFRVEIEKIRALRTCVYDDDYVFGANYTVGGDGVSGLKHSQHAINKNRQAHIGIVQDEQVCAKKSKSLRESKFVKRCPVRQFSIDGIELCVFRSVNEAAKAINRQGSDSLISRCCRGKSKSAFGFVWKYVDDDLDVKFCGNKNSNKPKQVDQLDFDNNLIKTHESIAEAARSIGKSSVSIRQCCLCKRQTAYGFVWQFSNHKSLFDTI